MSFQTLGVILLASSLALPALSTAAELPNHDRMVVGRCLGYYINPLFENVGKSIPEVFGVFCNNFDTNVAKIEHAVERYNADVKVDILEKIRQCLAVTKHQHLIEKYKQFGEHLLEVDGQDAEQSFPTGKEEQHLQKKAKIESSAGPSETDLSLKAYSPSVPSSGDGKKDVSPFKVFTKGLCETPEFVLFDDLNENDQKTTLSCFELCIVPFFTGIQDELLTGINMVEGTQGIKISSNMPVIDDFSKSCKTLAVKSNREITDGTNYWLQKYNNFYGSISRLSLPMHRIQMDGNLSDIYFDYSSCIKWECAMKNRSDAPYTDWLENQMNTSAGTNLYTALLTGPELFSFSYEDLIHKKKLL